MRTDALDYDLPEELIAQRPLAERDASRLFVPALGGEAAHARIQDLPTLLPPSLIVWNDTRVIPARLRGARPTGGKAELLLLEPLPEPSRQPSEADASGPVAQAMDATGTETWLAMGRANKPLKEGHRLEFEGSLSAEILTRLEGGQLEVRLTPPAGSTVMDAVHQAGEMPLPPYISRSTDATDSDRYQTVFARAPGAVAAPTAGLHFTEALRQALRDAGHTFAYVTLHVGPGTFRPVKTDTLDEHPMHRERYEIPQATCDAVAQAKAEGRPVMAVGTTVVRTLEASAAEPPHLGQLAAGPGETNLLIQPPYDFRIVDRLLTNFHLPRSTLLALIMAFAGEPEMRAAYAEAVRARYRFFSYGDAMLLERLQR